jgi:hypothetical protein
VLARRLSAEELAACDPGTVVGAVLLAPVRWSRGVLHKGTRIDDQLASALALAAKSGELTQPLRLAWQGPDDLHEDQAAERLAAAAAGTGIDPRPLRQSRLDLAARWNGVLHVRTEALVRLNAIDSLELFTLFHGQVVQAGQLVASVKVAPHIISESLVRQGIAIARDNSPLVSVWPYMSLEVAAIVTESVSADALDRFEAGARTKVEALGSRFLGVTPITNPAPDAAEEEIRSTLEMLALKRRLALILVGGVSAGDPLSPFYTALASLGGRVTRHGVPAHPGSMIWLGELGESRLLGVPQCGMFTLATAADLILPRLLTGERLTSGIAAELAHGGVLTRDMRFRFPPYARNLEAPKDERSVNGEQ